MAKTKTDATDLDAARDAIVDAALAHIAFDGCTDRCLKAGVADAGYDDAMALRAFPGGMADLVRHWSRLADRRMLEALEARDAGSMRMRERITAAVRLRIEVNAPHREAVRRTLGYLAMPQNARIAAANTWRTVDAIWYAVGDTSADFSYYTKRATLAAVYTSTVLYWLADESEDVADTWAFLDRRIADVMEIQKLKGRFSAPKAPRGMFRRPRRRTA